MMDGQTRIKLLYMYIVKHNSFVLWYNKQHYEVCGKAAVVLLCLFLCVVCEFKYGCFHRGLYWNDMTDKKYYGHCSSKQTVLDLSWPLASRILHERLPVCMREERNDYRWLRQQFVVMR
jgi:hypothetical protein